MAMTKLILLPRTGAEIELCTATTEVPSATTSKLLHTSLHIP